MMVDKGTGYGWVPAALVAVFTALCSAIVNVVVLVIMLLKKRYSLALAYAVGVGLSIIPFLFYAWVISSVSGKPGG
jgi:hypothetical protein